MKLRDFIPESKDSIIPERENIQKLIKMFMKIKPDKNEVNRAFLIAEKKLLEKNRKLRDKAPKKSLSDKFYERL